MAWRHWILTLGLGAALGTGCFTQFEKIDGTGEGGTGGACVPEPADCDTATPLEPFQGTGTVRVTDAIRDGNNTVLVGTFTGTVTFNDQGQREASSSGDGFLFEVTDQGMGVRLIIFSEADASSELYVDQHTLDEDLFVAGTYHEADATCGTSTKGIFMQRVMQDNSIEYSLCIDGDGTTELNLNDVQLGEADYAVVVGDFRGVLHGESAMGRDGFAISIDPMGVLETDAFLAGGAGDASIRAVEENFVGLNQWLIAGDFTGPLSLEVPNLSPQTRNAGSEQHLFVATYDGFAGDPNLDLTSLGGQGANHRLVGMRLLGPNLEDGVLLAEIEGSLIAGGATITAPEKAAVALTFDVPSGENNGMPFVPGEHVVVRGEELAVRALQPRGLRFAIAGHASGPVTLEGSDGQTWGTLENLSCARDLFLLDIEPAPQSWNGQRCGAQSVATTMAPAQGGGFAAVLDLPVGETVSLGGMSFTGPQTVLVAVPRL